MSKSGGISFEQSAYQSILCSVVSWQYGVSVFCPYQRIGGPHACKYCSSYSWNHCSSLDGKRMVGGLKMATSDFWWHIAGAVIVSLFILSILEGVIN